MSCCFTCACFQELEKKGDVKSDEEGEEKGEKKDGEEGEEEEIEGEYDDEELEEVKDFTNSNIPGSINLHQQHL